MPAASRRSTSRILPCKIAGIIPRGDGSDGTFNPDDWMEPKEQRKVDDFILYAIAAATQALEDAGWHPESDEDQTATGVLIGSGIGGLDGIDETSITLKEKGPRRVSPFFIPGRLINLASGHVSIQHGLQGPKPCRRDRLLDRRACDRRRGAPDRPRRCRCDGRGRHRIGRLPHRHRRLRRLPGAVDRFNDEPSKGSRPYDKDRDGFVMGEGAGCVVLEEYEHAKARGAKIYAEVIGYGLSGDAYHITAPAEDGDGAFRCMQMALKSAGISVCRHRLHQRAWHLDADGRRDRAQRRRAPRRQRRGQALDVLDQVGDRPSARRRRRGRGDLLGARHPRRYRAADLQPRQPLASTRRSTSCRTSPRSGRSIPFCPIRSVSAAPMPRWSFAACTERPQFATFNARVSLRLKRLGDG